MKAKNPSTGNFEEVYVKALDSLPVGTEIDFTGSASDIPVGWEQVDSYSTDEINTGKTWIDGRPIYRKCFNVLVSSQNFTFNHNISNLDVVTLYEASIKQQGGYIYPIPYYSEVAGYTIEGGLSTTECYFKLGSSINYNQYATVILEYTKSS